MRLRLFGAGSSRARTCPARERSVEVDATFCPSCYMVFRPEGAAALREFLQGARVPADVYLLRKMQTEDPDAGPVTCAPPGQTGDRQAAPPEPPPIPPVAASSASPSASAQPPGQAEPDIPDPAAAACLRGERCLFFAFEESPRQLARNMSSIGMDLGRWRKHGLLRLESARPAVYGLEAHLAFMHRAIREFRPAAVLVDPITDFTDSLADNKAMLTRLIDFPKMEEKWDNLWEEHETYR